MKIEDLNLNGKKEKSDVEREGKIEFYRDAKSEFRWKIISSNGRIIADSGEGYKNKEDCKNGLNRTRWHIDHSKSGKLVISHKTIDIRYLLCIAF